MNFSLWIANDTVRDIICPGQRQVNGSAIEGPREDVETSETEDEEEDWQF